MYRSISMELSSVSLYRPGFDLPPCDPLLWSDSEANTESHHITHTPRSFLQAVHHLSLFEVYEIQPGISKRLNRIAHVRLLTCRVCCFYVRFQGRGEATAACDEGLINEAFDSKVTFSAAWLNPVTQHFTNI